MPRASDRQLPHRAAWRLGARGVAAVILAVATVLMLAGAAARSSSALPAPFDTTSHLGAHLTAAVGVDGIVGPRSSHHEPAPGQRATPGALPVVPTFALLAGLLLITAIRAHAPRRVVRLRLPLRRGPPRDAFSR